MTKKDLKQLVTRFMEGETSIDEERRLADYFRSHPNEPEMEDIAAMFALFDTGMPIEGITDVEPKTQTPRRLTLHPTWWASVAAVAVVLVAFTFSIRYLLPRNEETTVHVVCQVAQPVTAQSPQEQMLAAQAEPMTEPAPEYTAKPTPQMAGKTTLALTKPKTQSETASAPPPEMLPDSVVEATLMQQRMAAQIKYKQQMLAQEQAERELQQQAMVMEALAEYVANMEYVETIQVW